MSKKNPTTKFDKWTWIDLGVRNDLIESFHIYDRDRPEEAGNLRHRIKWSVRQQLNNNVGTTNWICMIEHQADGSLTVNLGFAENKDAVWAKLQWGGCDEK
jgi:hypothetical protein